MGARYLRPGAGKLQLGWLDSPTQFTRRKKSTWNLLVNSAIRLPGFRADASFQFTYWLTVGDLQNSTLSIFRTSTAILNLEGLAGTLPCFINCRNQFR